MTGLPTGDLRDSTRCARIVPRITNEYQPRVIPRDTLLVISPRRRESPVRD